MPPQNYSGSYGYFSNRRKKRSRQRKILRLGLIILGFLGLILLAPNILKFFAPQVELPKFAAHLSFNFPREDNELDEIMATQLRDAEGDFAIFIESLNDTESFSLKSSERFPSASLYKIFLMAAVMEEVENGNLEMDDSVSATREHLEAVLGGEEFGYEDAPDQISYTIDQAMSRVGRISDNFSAVMLAEKVTWDKVQEAAGKIGTKNTQIKTPADVPIQTSAEDIGLFFRKLYQGQIVSASASEKIIEYLTLVPPASKNPDALYGQISKSPFVSRIPNKLPVSVKIVHKTGELARVRHDAGIVYLEGKPYIIVLMSQNLKDENEGIDSLASISESIYEYFKKTIQ